MSAPFQFRQRRANDHHPLVNRGSQAQLLLSTAATTRINFLASPKTRLNSHRTTMASTSPLLDLPAELRNTIYGLALTHSKPLHYRKPKGDGDKSYLYLPEAPSQQVHDQKPVEYNQLKYVNKQLYAETAGLELKFNDITFDIIPYSLRSSDLLTAWVTSISVAKRSWIKTITIRHANMAPGQRYLCADGPNVIARLTQVCNDVSSMRVKYHVPFWTFGSPQSSREGFYFFAMGQSIKYAYRGDMFDLQFSATANLQVFGDRWRDSGHPKVELAQLQTRNLTYFPDVPADNPVPIFKEYYTFAEDDEVVPEAEQWIGNKYFREWMEHGI